METGIAAKVAFLSRPENYPEPTQSVEVIQTHMSWVFLGEKLAWKLKKPVTTAYLDYGTIAARREHCAEELRLNRRFGSDVYLGIVPLTVDAEGRLHLGGRGPVVDWVVKMRRLPAERMLDRAIRAGAASEADVRKVVDTLWAHYRNCAPVALTGEEYRSRLARGIAANLEALRRPDYALPEAAFVPTCAQLAAVLADTSALFDARAEAGRIVEGHGDLRPEHVCLLDPPRIIDSLEFARDFRILDIADELAYLGLECERLGAPTFTQVLFDAYTHCSGDAPLARLVHFYQGLRACLRAKIALWHLDDPGPHNGLAWKAKAQGYLALAGAHTARAR
jgi:aminoglycoside phosphotransferase family enzyme